MAPAEVWGKAVYRTWAHEILPHGLLCSLLVPLSAWAFARALYGAEAPLLEYVTYGYFLWFWGILLFELGIAIPFPNANWAWPLEAGMRLLPLLAWLMAMPNLHGMYLGLPMDGGHLAFAWWSVAEMIRMRLGGVLPPRGALTASQGKRLRYLVVLALLPNLSGSVSYLASAVRVWIADWPCIAGKGIVFSGTCIEVFPPGYTPVG